MSWRLIKEPDTMVANEKLVREFNEMEPAPHDRPLSERRLMVYERIWRDGHFRPVVWASAVCPETNMTYRVNGKHTSRMLSGHPDLSKMPKFFVTVERYRCETLKDVAALYGTFDSGLASRTTADINASFAGTVPEIANIPARIINLCVSAISQHKWKDSELNKIPPAERAEELLDNIGFVKWFREIVTTTDRGTGSLTKHLTRAPVAYAMRATYERGPLVAKEFWLAVRDESAADNRDPSRTLARFLVRVALAGGRWGPTALADRRVVTPQEVYVKCINAWNAWRAGEKPAHLAYHKGSDLPKVSK